MKHQTIYLFKEKYMEQKIKKEKKPKEKLHSNRIRIILEEIGMSQQELADLTCDGNAGYISRIINGQRRCISLPIAIKISQTLGKSVEEVFVYKSSEELAKSEE
jgi:DNA-binding XRE family transcriptional regulator